MAADESVAAGRPGRAGAGQAGDRRAGAGRARSGRADGAGGGRPEVLAAWTDLCEVVDRGRLEVSRALQRQAGLTLAENLVLCQVAMAPQAQLQMVALARTLGIAKSAVTKTVDRLEGRGWLSRERDSGDRRAVRATLTPAGAAVFARAQPAYVAAVSSFLTGPLSEPDARRLHRLARTLLNSGPAALPHQEPLPSAGGSAGQQRQPAATPSRSR